jgi:CRISPR-associated protein Csm1
MTDRECVALGALLLDIGRFWQRTGLDIETFKELGPTKSPTDDHIAWSALFLKRYVEPHFPDQAGKLLNTDLYQGKSGKKDSGAQPDALSRIILDAHDLASPHEPGGPGEGDRTMSGGLLRAITDLVAYSKKGKDDRNAGKHQHCYPLEPLSLSSTAFPGQAGATSDNSEAYAKLWAAFITQHGLLPGKDLGDYLESLLYLLHKYAWCVSKTPFVSIYDSGRVAAALAVCLYDVSKTDRSASGEFMFVEGDLSGIQDFIYNPAFNGQELQDGMAKRLRGRSFYLSLLVSTLADYLALELGLSRLNILWSSGGHFVIAAPNTQATADRLTQARTAIQSWIWQDFRGALGVIIGHAGATRQDLADFGAIKSKLALETSALKLRQHEMPLALAPDFQDEVWDGPWMLRMGERVCVDTGRDMFAHDVKISGLAQDPPAPGEPLRYRSRESLLFDCIGRALVKARTIQLRRTADWDVAGSPARLPRSVEEAHRLKNAGRGVLIEFPRLQRVWLLTEQDEPQPGSDLCLRIVDHRNRDIEFLGVRGTAARGFQMFADAVRLDQEGHIVDFSDLAKQDEGANFLGVLRMDVDNLGHIFAGGLPTGHRSIVDIAALSRTMDWFFAGYLNCLVAEKNLYITYGGGDDLFLVGAWNEAVKVAEQIQSGFSELCGNSRDLHISGAISLCKGKYPVGRAAAQAGEMLDTVAKGRAPLAAAGDEGKNALAFLERRVPWADWTDASRLAEKLVSEIRPPEGEQPKVRRKFIHNLLDLYRLFIDPEREPAHAPVPPHIRWIALFKYSVVRNVEDGNLRATLINDIPRLQNYLSVLAGYVALRTRTGDKDTKPKE